MQIKNPADTTRPIPRNFPCEASETSGSDFAGAPTMAAAGLKLFDAGTLCALDSRLQAGLASISFAERPDGLEKVPPVDPVPACGQALLDQRRQRLGSACRNLHGGAGRKSTDWRGGHLRPVKKIFVWPALPAGKPPFGLDLKRRRQLAQPAVRNSFSDPLMHAWRPDIQQSSDGSDASEQFDNFAGVFKHARIISHN